MMIASTNYVFGCEQYLKNIDCKQNRASTLKRTTNNKVLAKCYITPAISYFSTFFFLFPVKDEMPDPDSFQIKEEDIKNFENCGDFVNGEF